MLFSVDKETGKTICLAGVPQSKAAAGFKANDWVEAVAAVLNGKVCLRVLLCFFASSLEWVNTLLLLYHLRMG